VLLYGAGMLRTRATERWRDLYTLADAERKELRDELAAARSVLAEQGETIAKLDALQMPVRVVESLREATEQASLRQAEILDQYRHHEKRAQDRHEGTLNVLNLIADRLGADEAG
jgi:crotonobetainyl-CoA:carnitine CoA-transferase CaiB-like acyl-CoA transferase